MPCPLSPSSFYSDTDDNNSLFCLVPKCPRPIQAQWLLHLHNALPCSPLNHAWLQHFARRFSPSSSHIRIHSLCHSSLRQKWFKNLVATQLNAIFQRKLQKDNVCHKHHRCKYMKANISFTTLAQ